MDRLVAVNRDILVHPAPRPLPPAPGSPWSLAIPSTSSPGGGSEPDIPDGDDLESLLDRLDREQQHEQRLQQHGLPA